MRMPIPGFSRYEADDRGAIWKMDATGWVRLSGTLPVNKHRKANYRVVCVWDDCGVRHRRMKIHRLVCAAFHGPAPEGKPLARHLNDDRDDNRPVNLAWGSNAENSADMVRNGKSGKGQRNASSKLTDDEAFRAMARLKAGESGTVIAADFGVSSTALYARRKRLA